MTDDDCGELRNWVLGDAHTRLSLQLARAACGGVRGDQIPPEHPTALSVGLNLFGLSFAVFASCASCSASPTCVPSSVSCCHVHCAAQSLAHWRCLHKGRPSAHTTMLHMLRPTQNLLREQVQYAPSAYRQFLRMQRIAPAKPAAASTSRELHSTRPSLAGRPSSKPAPGRVKAPRPAWMDEQIAEEAKKAKEAVAKKSLWQSWLCERTFVSDHCILHIRLTMSCPAFAASAAAADTNDCRHGFRR